MGQIHSIIQKFSFFFARACAYIEKRACLCGSQACLPAGRFETLQNRFHFASSSMSAFLFILSLPYFSLAAAPNANDSQPDIRIHAIQKLAADRTPQAKQTILSQLQQEQDPKVRASMIAALSALDGKNLRGIFESALKDADPRVRAQAVQGLGNAGGKHAVELLKTILLDDDNEGVRLTAAFWLGTLQDPSAVAALGEALGNDSDPHVRAQSAHSLKWLGTAAAKEQLKQAKDDDDVRVQKIANEP